MKRWMEGYASTDTYTKSYFREINPNFAAFSLLCANIRPPRIKNACELGFGFGMSINHNASTQNVNWFGNDYNPIQKNYAQRTSRHSKNGANLTDESFSQLLNESDWPKFEYIALHGIWSWVSEENQENILDFISSHLSDNGVVYISYNVAPGSILFSPIRELMKRQYDYGTKKSDPLAKRIKETILYIEKFLESGGQYVAKNELVRKRIEGLNAHNPAYILHEYLNEDWSTESFLSISEKLEGIKLKFACSANLQNSITSLNYTKEQSEFLKSTPDATKRNFISDLYWAETFRKDYWAKGPLTISSQERWDLISEFKLIQLKPREEISKEFTGRAFKGNIDNEIYNKVMSIIEKEETISIGQIAEVISDNAQEAAIQCTQVLLSLNFIGLETNNYFVETYSDKSIVETMNSFTCSSAVKSENAVTYLCSPVTGEAFPLTRSVLIYMDARRQSSDTFESACLEVVRECAKNNEFFQKDGKALTSESEAHSFIMQEVGLFIDKYGFILSKHGIRLTK